LTDEEIAGNLSIILELKNGGAAKALKLAENYGKDREVALEFLEGLIISLDKNLGSENLQILKPCKKLILLLRLRTSIHALLWRIYY